MELDSRFWSFFMFLAITALFVASICTPYEIKGVKVTFGKDGLWRVEENATSSNGGGTGHYLATQVLMCLAAVAVIMTGVGYAVIFKLITWRTQLLAFVSQLIAGLLSLIAVGVFAANDPSRSEGWWLLLAAGILLVLNAVVILVMPCMDSEDHKQAHAVYL